MVIDGLGAWVCADPAAFLLDNYLKYLGWALSDRVRTRRVLERTYPWCDCQHVRCSPTFCACARNVCSLLVLCHQAYVWCCFSSAVNGQLDRRSRFGCASATLWELVLFL